MYKFTSLIWWHSLKKRNSQSLVLSHLFSGSLVILAGETLHDLIHLAGYLEIGQHLGGKTLQVGQQEKLQMPLTEGLWHPPLTHIAREAVAPCTSPGYPDARYDNATSRNIITQSGPEGYKWFTMPSRHEKLSWSSMARDRVLTGSERRLKQRLGVAPFHRHLAGLLILARSCTISLLW